MVYICLYRPPSKRHLGACAIYFETTVIHPNPLDTFGYWIHIRNDSEEKLVFTVTFLWCTRTCKSDFFGIMWQHQSARTEATTLSQGRGFNKKGIVLRVDSRASVLDFATFCTLLVDVSIGILWCFGDSDSECFSALLEN